MKSHRECLSLTLLLYKVFQADGTSLQPTSRFSKAQLLYIFTNICYYILNFSPIEWASTSVSLQTKLLFPWLLMRWNPISSVYRSLGFQLFKYFCSCLLIFLLGCFGFFWLMKYFYIFWILGYLLDICLATFFSNYGACF